MALYPSKNFKLPKWTGRVLQEIMEMLTSQDGIVDYQFMCSKFRKEVINSIIEYNLMHLRPTCTLLFDVPLHESPIVTAKSQAGKVAMEKVMLKNSNSSF